jgi:hypothetical protein
MAPARKPSCDLDPHRAPEDQIEKEGGMTQQRLGIIMNGVTCRMGMNQHLILSSLAIRAQ